MKKKRFYLVVESLLLIKYNQEGRLKWKEVQWIG
jgi:hypothetical protein